MIDIESQVFTKVATALRTSFSIITVTSRTTFMPDSFPCVCIEEADNYSFRSSRDTGSNENHVEVMYEVNAYSNKSAGSKAECRQMISVVDRVMDSLGFTRTGMTPMTADEPMQYRIVARYTAVVSKNEVIYRR